MTVIYGICVLMMVFSLVYLGVFISEGMKTKRNPDPLKKNYDKRFRNIKNVYSHGMYEIKRGC